MKRIRIMGLCLVAAFALSALAASFATAEPVFVTKAVVGGTAASHIPQAGTLGAAFLEGSVSHSKITCTGGTSTGEVTGPKTVGKNVATFTGCESGGLKCESSPTPEGVIITKNLAGNVNGITSSLPGVRLFSEATGRGGILAEFECGGVVKVVVKGSVIGSFSGAAGTTATAAETGKLLPIGSLTFAEAGGIQKYTSFSEGPEAGQKEQLSSEINSGTPELSGQSVVAKLHTVPSTWGVGITK
jgi:hypothetical protein